MARVLLVEDVEDNRELARLLLEAEGHEVIEAHSGTEALSALAGPLPDLVLLDLSLPGMGGFAVLDRLRRDPRTAALRVVALTAHAMAGDRERVLAAGFDAYLAKPIVVSSFGQAITTQLAAK